MEQEPKPACTQSETTQGEIQFPSGLLGFEEIKKYQLLGSSEEAPFLWLKMAEDPKLAFLVISPAMLMNDYHPEISPEDTEFLGLMNPKDAMVFNIVTVHADGAATLNLKGPVVVNRNSLIGKQVIPLNSSEYSLQHPLPVNSQSPVV